MAPNLNLFALHILLPLLGLLAVIRLWKIGLAGRFRTLVAFLLFHALRSGLLFASRLFPHPRTVYGWTWVATEPFLWFLSILLVLRIHSAALEDFKGLQTMGRWAFAIAVLASVLISGLTLVPTSNSATDRYPILFFVVLAERGITFSLVIFILLILFFLSWYPIRLSRNMMRHCVICSVYFLCGTIGFLVRNVKGDEIVWMVNTVLMIITALCWVGWLMLLSPEGEAPRVTTRREFRPEDEQRLVDQLTAINATMLRAVRK